MTIETKFSYGDHVYLIADNAVQQGVIIQVSAATSQQVVMPNFNGKNELPPYKVNEEYIVKYNNFRNECYKKADQLFATKQELLNSL